MLLVRDGTFSLRRTQGKASSGAGAREPVAGTLPSSFVQLSRNLACLELWHPELPSIFPSAGFRMFSSQPPPTIVLRFTWTSWLPLEKDPKGSCLKTAVVAVHSHGPVYQRLSYPVCSNGSAPFEDVSLEDPHLRARVWGRASVCRMRCIGEIALSGNSLNALGFLEGKLPASCPGSLTAALWRENSFCDLVHQRFPAETRSQ